MKKRKANAEIILQEENPEEGWTEEARCQFDQGLRMLARMIAADILKKRDAAYKKEQEAKITGNPQPVQNLVEIITDTTDTTASSKNRSRKGKF